MSRDKENIPIEKDCTHSGRSRRNHAFDHSRLYRQLT